MGRLRKRANSCLAIGDPGIAVEAAARQVQDFYAALGRPAWVQVERGDEVDDALVAAGWSPLPVGEAHFLVGSVSRALRTARRVTGDARPESRREARGSPGGAAVAEDSDGVLAEVLGDDDGVLAAGRAVLDGDWLGLHEPGRGPGVPPPRPGHGGRPRPAGARGRAGRHHGLAARRDRNRPALALYEGSASRPPHLPYLVG